MESHQFEQRLSSLEARHQRVVHGFGIAIAIMLIALIAVGKIASREPGRVTNLDRRVVRAIFVAQYEEVHPVPPGSQDSPEARTHQMDWMDYESRVMRRYEEGLAGQGVRPR